MKEILIANTKGGCGKTTLATNLAGYFASLGHTVAFTDLDRQQSATEWLARRPADAAPIHLTNHKTPDKTQVKNIDWHIVDSPGGFKDEKLFSAIKSADCILVPIQPSAFDTGATEQFLDLIIEEKAIRKQKTFVGLVGMRVNSRANAALKLTSFMEQANFPVLTSLRNAQCYVTAAELGLSIFDMRASQVAPDILQWQALIDWVMDVSVKE